MEIGDFDKVTKVTKVTENLTAEFRELAGTV